MLLLLLLSIYILNPMEAIFLFLFICRMKASKVGDERINLTTEILNGIKIVKMYCWEEPFSKLIETLRQ